MRKMSSWRKISPWKPSLWVMSMRSRELSPRKTMLRRRSSEESELGAGGDEGELREDAMAGEKAAGGRGDGGRGPAEDGSEGGKKESAVDELVGERAGGELEGHELVEEGREGPVREEGSMEANRIEGGVAKDKENAEAE